MDFWPDEVTAGDVDSPGQILDEIGKELSRKVPFFECSVSISPQKDRRILGFEIKNCRNDKILKLFEVLLSVEFNYPCAIEPPTLELPGYLLRKQVIPARSGLYSNAAQYALGEALRVTMGQNPEQTVENEWICATPVELRTKLKTIFRSDAVLSQISSLKTS